MHYPMTHIERQLMACRALGDFCSQSGWIDNTTLDYEILEQDDHHVLAFVQFEEILLEGSGRIAGRIPHQACVQLTLDRYGEVEHVELV